MRVYVDGVWDMFHIGHLRCLKAAYLVAIEKSRGGMDLPQLIVGVVSDRDAASYKRVPVIAESDRAEIIRNIKCVDEVIVSCPLTLTNQFLDEHDIDLVVHGFSNEQDKLKQLDFFKDISDRFLEIKYNFGTSTSALIEKLAKRDD